MTSEGAGLAGRRALNGQVCRPGQGGRSCDPPRAASHSLGGGGRKGAPEGLEPQSEQDLGGWCGAELPWLASKAQPGLGRSRALPHLKLPFLLSFHPSWSHRCLRHQHQGAHTQPKGALEWPGSRILAVGGRLPLPGLVKRDCREEG